MALSRQDLPVLDAEKYKAARASRRVPTCSTRLGKDIILIATGSEVSLIVKAAEELKAAGINATVVSMPSFKIFDEQDEPYKASLLPEDTPKIAIEAGATMGWYKYIGHNGGRHRYRSLRRLGTWSDCSGEARHQRRKRRRARKEAGQESKNRR